jgi:hypothetical protein
MIFDPALGRIGCEWDPSLPKQLSKHEREQYRVGRDAFLAELTKDLNGAVLTFEV